MEVKISELLQNHDGVFRRSELLRVGLLERSLAVLLAAGELRKHPGGIFSRPQTPDWWVDARTLGADLGCISAAEKLGLWVLRRPQQPHVTVSNSRVSGPFVVHRRRDKYGAAVSLVLQCMRCLPELEGLVVAESAVVLGKVGLKQLREATSGPRNANLRTIVERINPASESILETVARYLLENAGYRVQIQKYFQGLGRLDMLVDGILGIELDGRAHHSTSEAFVEDRRRNNFYVVNGIPTIRATYALVVHAPEEFLNLVRAALARHQPHFEG